MLQSLRDLVIAWQAIPVLRERVALSDQLLEQEIRRAEKAIRDNQRLVKENRRLKALLHKCGAEKNQLIAANLALVEANRLRDERTGVTETSIIVIPEKGLVL